MSAKKEETSDEDVIIAFDEGSVGGVLYETLYGKIDDSRLRPMLIAGMLAEDSVDTPPDCPEETRAILKQIAELGRNDTPEQRNERVSRFTPDAKTVIVASKVAEMRYETRALRADEILPISREDMEQQGKFLAQVMNSGGVLGKIPGEMAKAFNALSAASNTDVSLERTADGAFYVKAPEITKSIKRPS